MMKKKTRKWMMVGEKIERRSKEKKGRAAGCEKSEAEKKRESMGRKSAKEGGRKRKIGQRVEWKFRRKVKMK